MARDYAKQFYASSAWRRCRSSFIAFRRGIDGGLCQRCHDNLGYIVHHKTEITPYNINDPSITLNHANLQFLCLDCHNQTHGRFERVGLCFDDNGDPIPPM